MSLATSSRWKNATGRFLDLLLPPLCLSCDRPVGTDRTLCPACWSQIHFITPPLCGGCGAPFEVPVEGDMLCSPCLTAPPHFKSARAAMLYDDGSRDLVLSFKHSDRTHPARTLASWMHRAGESLCAEADYIMPVPLHVWRLFRRRYNQAALLAHKLAEISGTPFLPDALRRRRATATQGHMSRKERLENVKGAFAVSARYKPILADKNVLLVDDVLTTGATVNECSRVLLDAGAKAINVLTLARVKGFT